MFWRRETTPAAVSSTAFDLPPPAPPTGRVGMPSILFLGDSNTEIASHPDTLGFQVRFTQDYARKADTINRGNSGWNTRFWLKNLDRLVAEWMARPPSLVLVMLGTNDACAADGTIAWAHVPLDEFKSNLNALASAFQSSWGSRVLFVTALPFDDNSSKWHGSRTNADAGKYAAAMVALGQQIGVPVLDLWTPLQDSIATIFYDGLHLNRDGNVQVHMRMRAAIASAFPDLAPESLPIYYP
ncbi:Aste57867_8243 [Aphanomyces stellatus]|uniref:Aste57867_8243 protein n=1 Tax=Aphanomyces stellatus TaxID=120398 RepID=A0A485KJQ6_9STRA|nr:hypothetical protein As57867_008212 [Aphanomyces stellatus]VFT85130.1 Aste57867_8243 [Aphanomyces stellatus]